MTRVTKTALILCWSQGRPAIGSRPPRFSTHPFPVPTLLPHSSPRLYDIIARWSRVLRWTVLALLAGAGRSNSGENEKIVGSSKSHARSNLCGVLASSSFLLAGSGDGSFSGDDSFSEVESSVSWAPVPPGPGPGGPSRGRGGAQSPDCPGAGVGPPPGRPQSGAGPGPAPGRAQDRPRTGPVPAGAGPRPVPGRPGAGPGPAPGRAQGRPLRTWPAPGRPGPAPDLGSRIYSGLLGLL